MKIIQLHLQNYGRFEDLTIKFATKDEHGSNVTVIVGNNGAGKSQILQGLSTGLSWFVNGLLHLSGEKTSRSKEDNGFLKYPHEGEWIQQPYILNNKEYSELMLSYKDMNSEIQTLSINATKENVLNAAVYGTEGTGFNPLIEQYTHLFNVNKKTSLPLIANYTIDRNVEAQNISAGDSFMKNQLFAYKDFLNAGSNYNHFFQWFRDNEDIENEQSRSKITTSAQLDELIEAQMELRQLLFQKEHFDKIDFFPNDELRYQSLAELCAEIESLQSHINSLNVRSYVLTEAISQNRFASLDSVRQAIEYFTELKNPCIRRQGTPTMIVEKDGEELDVNQLSQGEKSLLAVVGDIARRLAILNPSLDDPLKGEGVVMIDEVDLHLHPKWQHDLIDKLVKTFPNVQFILTTHSPHIISDNPNTLVYALDDGELTQVPNVYGEDVNTVLTKVFDVDIRDSKVQERFDEIYRDISDENFTDAENKIVQLEQELPTSNIELLRCRLHLTQAQLAKKESVE